MSFFLICSLAFSGDSHLLPVIPVPLRDLTECHADLFSDSDLRRIVPNRVSIEVFEQDHDLVWIFPESSAILKILEILLFEPKSSVNKAWLTIFRFVHLSLADRDFRYFSFNSHILRLNNLSCFHCYIFSLLILELHFLHATISTFRAANILIA